MSMKIIVWRSLTLAALLVSLALPLTAAAPANTAPVKAVPMPLKHFVYIIQENITFDHYFGTYPGADGIPKGVKFAYQPGETPQVTPFHLSLDIYTARPQP